MEREIELELFIIYSGHYKEKTWEDVMQWSKQNKQNSIKDKHGVSVSVFAKAAG